MTQTMHMQDIEQLSTAMLRAKLRPPQPLLQQLLDAALAAAQLPPSSPEDAAAAAAAAAQHASAGLGSGGKGAAPC